MIRLLLMILCFAGALLAPRFVAKVNRSRGESGQVLSPRTGNAARALLSALGILLMLSTSFTVIGQDEVGHLKKIYGFKSLKPGAVIAARGEKGPQAHILGPGLNFRPFLNVFYRVEELPIVDVPEGHYGFLVAKDGVPLREDQFLADAWTDPQQMLNARHFLTEGNGQKGPQLTVLTPGRYRINRYLFEIAFEGHRATEVPAGHVLVVKSNVQEVVKDGCTEVTLPNSDISVPIVPKGCIGVWQQAYQPGTYYLNRRAYQTTLVDTRIQTWTYKGGYSRRTIILQLDQAGEIQQSEQEEEIRTPEDAADRAVMLRVEGWEVPQELRVLAQVTPENAPFVVASVGDLEAVENKIVTPAVRSIVRNVTAGRHRKTDPDASSPLAPEERPVADLSQSSPRDDSNDSIRRVLDLQDRRPELEEAVLRALIPEGRKAAVEIREVRFGDPVLPPELLLARKREQLANQMLATFEKERLAQDQRIETEKARALAQQQPTLVAAEIAQQAAEREKETLRLQGEGERLRLEAIAQGQRAQAQVLGQSRTYELAALKELLAFAAEHPDAIKVPQVLVEGSGNDLAAAAGIFGVLGNTTLSRGAQGLASDKP